MNWFTQAGEQELLVAAHNAAAKPPAAAVLAIRLTYSTMSLLNLPQRLVAN